MRYIPVSIRAKYRLKTKHNLMTAKCRKIWQGSSHHEDCRQTINEISEVSDFQRSFRKWNEFQCLLIANEKKMLEYKISIRWI